MLNIKSHSGATTKTQNAAKQGIRVMAVSLSKGVGYSRLFEHEQTTMQMLVHPPVTVGTAGRSAPLHCFYSNLHFIFHNAF